MLQEHNQHAGPTGQEQPAVVSYIPTPLFRLPGSQGPW